LLGPAIIGREKNDLEGCTILALAAICDLDIIQFWHHLSLPPQHAQRGSLYGAARGLRRSWKEGLELEFDTQALSAPIVWGVQPGIT